MSEYDRVTARIRDNEWSPTHDGSTRLMALHYVSFIIAELHVLATVGMSANKRVMTIPWHEA